MTAPFDSTQPAADEMTLSAWREQISAHLSRQLPNALQAALPALSLFPQDYQILVFAVIAALLDEKPEPALRYVQRLTKNFFVNEEDTALFKAVAQGQQGLGRLAWQTLEQHGLRRVYNAVEQLPISYKVQNWFRWWLDRIQQDEARRREAEKKAEQEAEQKRAAALKAQQKAERAAKAAAAKQAVTVVAPVAEEAAAEFPPLPRFELQIPLTIALPETLDGELIALTRGFAELPDIAAFRLRHEFTQLGLLQGFDDLLCLPLLHNIETYWYQVEAVRKALKQFRGRVLLADEVGLGKTIEAGMILKEYLLRGMAERVLILTPATLVGQWQEEMATKFDIEFITSYDSAVRNLPAAFWAQPRVIASIALARRAEHQALLAEQSYDLVIVDEAHHLKNRATANYKLVNSLNKRFLLLLSATPVQNSLVELYNLLTLLKPGIFKTEKEFRASYMTSGKPRVPANRDKMRDLMREVMIRNTRSLVDVHLPPRHAVTLKLDATDAEAKCYAELSRLVAKAHAKATTQDRLALRYLLSAAGSTASTATSAIARYAEKRQAGKPWLDLVDRYWAIKISGKEQALLELLHRNEAEKKMIFVHHRETLRRLSELCEERGIPHAIFEGGMTGPAKDAAVTRFRDEVPLLICTESGGEGRNLQFCNTLINFDLPWNPMAIEQRIGRVHRIGQTREVFIFNLVVRDTLEEHVLQILDEKINMFELVVGEIDAILGEMDEEQDFAEMVFSAWVETSEGERAQAFDALGTKLLDARKEYETVKALDDELFGEEFVAA